MLAVCKTSAAFGSISVREREPRDAGPDEIRIKMVAAGICGTDIQIYNNSYVNPNKYGFRYAFMKSIHLYKKCMTLLSSLPEKSDDIIICENSWFSLYQCYVKTLKHCNYIMVLIF